MAKTKTRGFGVLCPHCMDPAVKIDLNDLAGAMACECGECGASWSVAEAVAEATERLERWQAVARWIDIAPEKPKDD